MSQRFKYLFPLSIVLAWIFDFLFWGKIPGVSAPLFILLLLGAGYWLLQSEKKTLPRQSLWLLAPLTFFALMSFMRLEPMTLFFNFVVLLFLLALLANTLLNGNWLDYGLGDHLVNLVALLPRGFVHSGQSLSAGKEERGSWRRWLPYLRGAFIALPILLIFSVLLASADLVFSQYLESFFELLEIEKLGELLFRIFYILVLGTIFAGIYFYALKKSEDQKLLRENRSEPIVVLGFRETATILGLLNLLFSAFVFVQLRYFFGGAANIARAGFTYAEYARRGFGEMTLVALFALLLFIILSGITRRDSGRERKVFSGLAVMLLVLVGVILLSAYQRLLLYESAYGFTRLRTYSHAFMIWLGLLLAATVWLQLRGRGHYVMAAVMLAAFGFVASLSLLNVDAFITRANFQRAQLGYELDLAYLFGQMSEDAVPTVAALYQSALDAGNQQQADNAAVILICHAWRHSDYAPDLPWQSFNLSRFHAGQHWEDLRSSGALDSYSIEDSGGDHLVFVDDEGHDCSQFRWFD